MVSNTTDNAGFNRNFRSRNRRAFFLYIIRIADPLGILLITFYSCRTFLKTIVLIMAMVFARQLFAQPLLVRELAPDVFYYFGDELQKKSANCVWIVFKEYVLAIDANYP